MLSKEDRKKIFLRVAGEIFDKATEKDGKESFASYLATLSFTLECLMNNYHKQRYGTTRCEFCGLLEDYWETIQCPEENNELHALYK